MKKMVADKIQKVMKEISFRSVGRSAPPGIYERKIPEKLKELICEKRNN